mmetsp:Transcript_33819/g.73156  ORF Transcript_33819/g.73156 Transcript_33819/m.73156 type:complete len:173 (+) Transcript_33819:121-639(+)
MLRAWRSFVPSYLQLVHLPVLVHVLILFFDCHVVIIVLTLEPMLAKSPDWARLNVDTYEYELIHSSLAVAAAARPQRPVASSTSAASLGRSRLAGEAEKLDDGCYCISGSSRVGVGVGMGIVGSSSDTREKLLAREALGFRSLQELPWLVEGRPEGEGWAQAKVRQGWRVIV